MSQPPAQNPPFPSERAFVVQFQAEAALAQGRWVGRVEHVVSGQATHFDTLDALLAFLAQVLTTRSPTLDSATPPPPAGPEAAPAAWPPGLPNTRTMSGQASSPGGHASKGPRSGQPL